MNSSVKSSAYTVAVLNAVIIGLSFLFVKIALQYSNPIDTLAYRFIIAFTALSIPVILGKVRISYQGKPLLPLILLAAMYPLGFFLFQTYGLQHATSSEGGILAAFGPVLTAILAAFFLKETTSPLQKLSISLSVAGVVLIFVMKGAGLSLSNLTGIILLFLSNLTFAGYSIMARSLLKRYTLMEVTYFMLGVGCTVFLSLSLWTHAFAGTLGHFLDPLANAKLVGAVLYLGVLSSLATALAGNYAISKLGASRASIFSNLSTVVSIAAGALLFGEELGIHHAVGTILIVGGVWGTNRLGKKEKEASGSRP